METLLSRRLAKASSAVALLLGLAAFGTGCAYTTDKIELAYPAAEAGPRIPGAEAVKLDVTVTDARPQKDKVGAKKNGWGMEAASIVASNDVAKVLQDGLHAELAARGFQPGAGTAHVGVELVKLMNVFEMGFTSVDANAEIIMNVSVRGGDGVPLWGKQVVAMGANPGGLLAGGTLAKVALDRALKAGVMSLMSDGAFIDALLKAGGATGRTASR